MLLLEDVHKSYQQPDGTTLPILSIASFHMAAGEQIALVGQSGSGKTTLLHLIAGIARADRGRIEIDGCDITRLSEAEVDRFRAKTVGYVFQTFNLLAGFSALENVLLGMSFVGGRPDRDRATQLLEQVGLGHRLTHKPGQLSVGEQQRVAVARALANRPKLLLADEPTANVDAGNQRQMVDLLQQRCSADDVALLVVTHSEEVAERFGRVEHLQHLGGRAEPVAQEVRTSA